ncbi:hypothetical protein E2L08_15900 [Palleronia sediminis]|uniref:RCK C-terminal domain-containing protein n=1 Tax=Palleronia sediminis TaxID=2547833 RepID=A0A4R6A2K4_9RHOB|nr:hypothetical protein E2L08_15900 [Palleronia sediminis]
MLTLARSKRLERWATPIIRRALQKSTDFDLRDYAHVLHLRENYGVGRIEFEENSSWAGKTLEELTLPSRSMNVLGVEHNDGTYEGVPDGDTVIEAGDRVVLYGQRDQLDTLK